MARELGREPWRPRIISKVSRSVTDRKAARSKLGSERQPDGDGRQLGANSDAVLDGDADADSSVAIDTSPDALLDGDADGDLDAVPDSGLDGDVGSAPDGDFRDHPDGALEAPSGGRCTCRVGSSRPSAGPKHATGLTLGSWLAGMPGRSPPFIRRRPGHIGWALQEIGRSTVRSYSERMGACGERCCYGSWWGY